jgi:hypothetical protein
MATGVSGRFAYGLWTKLHFADADARASLPLLQPVESIPESTKDGGGKGNGLKSGQMPTRVDP